MRIPLTANVAQRILGLSPDDLRSLFSMMTDEELADVMLYFRLGVLAFLQELNRSSNDPRARLRIRAIESTDAALRKLLAGGDIDDARELLDWAR